MCLYVASVVVVVVVTRNIEIYITNPVLKTSLPVCVCVGGVFVFPCARTCVGVLGIHFIEK